MVRFLDFLAALAGLILLSPLLLVVALLVKLEDGGPVFYRQERVGWKGKPFRIFKFRTMTWGADRSGPLLTVGDDARITRVGRWLRRTKADELPQLINVVKGEMALVGPRPEVPRYVAHYTPEQARVLELRPGITDPASIAYRHENDALPRCDDPEAFYIANILPNKIRINMAHAAQAGVWSNLKVILATLGLMAPPVPVRPPGDRRAFDRVPWDATVRISSDGTSFTQRGALNLGQGGILLQGAEFPVGSACELIITPDDRAIPPMVTHGIIIGNDGRGAAVRFAQPIDEAGFQAFKGRP